MSSFSSSANHFGGLLLSEYGCKIKLKTNILQISTTLTVYSPPSPPLPCITLHNSQGGGGAIHGILWYNHKMITCFPVLEPTSGQKDHAFVMQGC